MSHKTGKRVLTASTSLALAVVGLAASPLAAHAAGATLESLCGKTDRLVLTKNTGVYSVMAADGTTVAFTIDTNAATPVADDGGGKTENLTQVGTSTSWYLTLPASSVAGTNVDMWDGATTADNPDHLTAGYYLLDQAGNTVVSQSAFNAITSATCEASATIPVPTMTSNRITVTKGTGLVWNVAAAEGGGATAVSASWTDATGAHVRADGQKLDIAWPAGSTDTSTIVVTILGSAEDVVTVAASANTAGGYVGGTASYQFQPGATQYAWVAPVANDRDGTSSDTVSVTPRTGVSYYYTTDSGLYGSVTGTYTEANLKADATDSSNALGTMIGTNDTADAATAAARWVKVPDGAATFNRPPVISPDYVNGGHVYVVGIATSPYNFSDLVSTHKADLKFTDTTKVASLPAPQTVNGDGPNDSYTLPSTAGVEWTISSAKLGTDVANYTAGDSRLGQTVPVYTNGADTYTFTAEPGTGYTWADGTTTAKTFTADYDSRYVVTPVAPTWTDQTGIVNDAVTFPAAYSGLTGYLFTLTTGTAAPAQVPTVSATGQVTVNGWYWVDASWYGKSISLTDIQKIAGGSSYDPMQKTHVWVWTDANQTTSVLAKDATDTPVKHQWDYNFTNANNIVPVAPTQAAVVGDPTKYTLTFPVDPKVVYSVTDADGITKTIAYGDLGKALTYSGTVTVTAKSAQPGVYVIQPNADGSAPAPWIYKGIGTVITPEAPTQSNQAGTASDTFTLPAQTGIIWNVNGQDVDPGNYGKAISTGGATSVVAVAQAGSGYTIADGAQVKWSLDFTDAEPTNVKVSNDIDGSASVPTTTFSWSADGATSYDVTYHKILINGSAGPEVDWMMDTTDTSAKFVAEKGDKYVVTVTAKNDIGEAEPVSSTVEFGEGDPLGDVTTGQGTFSAGWNLLGKSALSGLPYYGDTAALAAAGASWTYTVPAGTKSFDLFATVHQYGSKGKITVNGQNWADFETNPSYWGTVSNPYGYPVRRVQGWDDSKTATITVTQTEGGNLYLALDAYRVNK